MKITKAENYKKPHYAVAIAAALVAMTAGGCGEVRLGGATALPDDHAIYDGDIQVDPGYDDEVELAGDVAVYPDEPEINKTQEQCEPADSHLALEGGVEFIIPESN